MKWLRKTLSFLFQLILMLVLPFVLLIRGSIWLYEAHQWYPWLALLTSFAVVFVLLLIYVVMLYNWITNNRKLGRSGLKVQALIVGLLLAVFVGYGLFNLSGSNAKSEEVKEEFTSLHPFMRLGVGTLVLLDESLLITDMSRVSEDYKKMGLKSLKNSLHYEQKDGYVHAMDLRTKDRHEWQNRLTKWYFMAMGFNTLRHVGTGDHLHISLSTWENPGAI